MTSAPVSKSQSKYTCFFFCIPVYTHCVFAHSQDSTDTNVSELRRQIHIQSEQKRRAQIKDGFEDLRSELPACLNKKMSKVTLLHRSKYKQMMNV